MPVHKLTEAAKLQAHVSSYLLESLGKTFLTESGFSFWAHHDILPKSSPLQLDTSFMDIFFPGMFAKYNLKPVDVEFTFLSFDNLTMKEGDQTMSFKTDLAAQFWVLTSNTTKELAVEIELHKMFFDFQAIIDGM